MIGVRLPAVTVDAMSNDKQHDETSRNGLVATGTCRYFDEFAVSRAEIRRQEELRRSRDAHPSSR